MKVLRCKNCKGQAVKLEKRESCSTCGFALDYREEGGEDGEGYMRNTVEEDGECKLGTAFGEGCLLAVCIECGAHVEHIPMGVE
jgi:hypothetical protein